MKFKLVEDSNLVVRDNTLPVNDDPNNLDRQIINKIFTLSKAIADEFGWDYKLVAKDIIRDLELINKDEINDVVNASNPIDAMTYAMVSDAKEMGVTSNEALHFLLDMDVDDAVQQLKSFLTHNRGMLRGGQGGFLPFNGHGQRAIHETLNFYKKWDSSNCIVETLSFKKYGYGEGNKVQQLIESSDGAKQGGVLIVSSKLDSIPLDKNKLLNIVKQYLATIKNTLSKNSIRTDIMSDESIPGVTISNNVKGSYRTDSGKIVDSNNSYTIEILDVDNEVLVNLAKELVKKLHQESILVRFYDGSAPKYVQRTWEFNYSANVNGKEQTGTVQAKSTQDAEEQVKRHIGIDNNIEDIRVWTNESLEEGASIYDGYEAKRKKTEVKGAKGWFVHPNPGDPEAMRRFNHSVSDNASADGTVGEVSSSGGEASGGMGESLNESNYQSYKYKGYEILVDYDSLDPSNDELDMGSLNPRDINFEVRKDNKVVYQCKGRKAAKDWIDKHQKELYQNKFLIKLAFPDYALTYDDYYYVGPSNLKELKSMKEKQGKLEPFISSLSTDISADDVTKFNSQSDALIISNFLKSDEEHFGTSIEVLPIEEEFWYLDIFNESLLQDLHNDSSRVKDEYGENISKALDRYCSECGNDLGKVLYSEETWNEFMNWCEENNCFTDNLDESSEYGMICQMPIKRQRKIRKMVKQSLKDNGYSGTELEDRLHDAMTGRLCDLEDAIDISKLDEEINESVSKECALDRKVRKICEEYSNAKVGATPSIVKYYYDRGQNTFIINVLDEGKNLIKTYYTSSRKERDDCLNNLKEQYKLSDISRYTLSE